MLKEITEGAIKNGHSETQATRHRINKKQNIIQKNKENTDLHQKTGGEPRSSQSCNFT